jgi:hypothetical protein
MLLVAIVGVLIRGGGCSDESINSGRDGILLLITLSVMQWNFESVVYRGRSCKQLTRTTTYLPTLNGDRLRHVTVSYSAFY